MDPPNIFHAEFEYDEDDPPGFQAGVAEVGKAAGGEELSVRVFEIPSGQSLCPYHYEYVEEWLIVLEGPAAIRTPDGTRPLEPGAVVRFAPGPDGAHKVICHGDRTTRVLMFSSAREPAVAVYPDSDKIGVWPGNKADNLIVRRADGDVGYYDGESS
jgi:uncharacterized cupin superfamily protein